MISRASRAASQSLSIDPLFGRIGGIAHSQIDHVDPVAPLAILQLVDLAEQVGRKVANPRCNLEVVSSMVSCPSEPGIRLRIDHVTLAFDPCHSGRSTRVSRPNTPLIFTLTVKAAGCTVTWAANVTVVTTDNHRGIDFAIISLDDDESILRCTTSKTHQLVGHPLDRPRSTGSIWIIINKGADRLVRSAPFLLPPSSVHSGIGRRCRNPMDHSHYFGSFGQDDEGADLSLLDVNSQFVSLCCDILES